MDAGAADPLRPARPEEGEEKAKCAESQDDGYETSNSGEPLRRKPSSAEGSPAPPPAPPPDYQHYQQQQQFPPRYEPPPPQPPQPPPQQPALPLAHAHQQPPQHHPHQHQHHPDHYHYQFPKYDAYAMKRSPDAPYDMSQFAEPKREHDMYNGGIKREMEDPYSFVEEEALCGLLPPPHLPPHLQHQAPLHHQLMLNQPKKRGRKKKIKDENGMEIKVEGMEGAPRPVKERKKHDRFNGMSEEEVARRTLPDHLAENLDIIIIGINPGLFAAYKGHHYAGPGNHFWKCLYLSGLTREQMSADEDYKLLNFGIGFTNMVPRATKGSADLTRREIKEGSAVLLEKLQTFRPKVAVFNGKLIYEVFSGKKDFCFGKQPDTIPGTNTYMWVMPSSSARCAQLPRAADKVPFYAALKRFRDYLNGLLPACDERELVFPDNTARRPQDELEIRRLTMEPEPGDTIILEDGTEVPLKKKRGRPKKIKLENGETAPPTPRAPRQPRAPAGAAAVGAGGEPIKKKRGRPKKVRPDDPLFMQPPRHDPPAQQYMHQGGGGVGGVGGGAGAGGGAGGEGFDSSMYQMHQMDHHQPYFQQQQQGGNSMESLDMSNLARYGSPGLAGGPGGAGAAGSPAPYCASPRGYSPRSYASPIAANTTPQPQQFPGSPGPGGGGGGAVGGVGAGGGFPAPSPPRGAYSSPARCEPMYSSPAQASIARPYSRSPGPGGFPAPSPGPGGFPAPSPGPGGFPAPSPGPGGFPAPSPAPYASPYSAHSSPARPSPYQDHYQHQQQQNPGGVCPLGGGGGGGGGGELGSAPASPGGMAALDFEPPRSPPRASPPPNDPNDDNSKQSGGGGGGGGSGSAGSSLHDGMFDERLGYLPDDKDHYHYQDHAGGGGGTGVAESPRLEQLHQAHPGLYNNYARSTPPGGGGGGGEHAPYSPHAAFRPPEHAPHTPHSQPPGSPAEFSNGGSGAGGPGAGAGAGGKPQDVASKSLSGLESLVDQIPSIAEGEAPPLPPLPEYPPLYPHYPPYSAAPTPYHNNGYGAPFVGYGGGWSSVGGVGGMGGVGGVGGGAALVRPTPGYLSEWQYGYSGPAPPYPPYSAPYYTPPPAHHQQFLPAPLLDLHKAQEPPLPSVPSVGFGGFC